MINAHALEAAGYRHYEDRMEDSRFCRGLWQRRVKDDSGQTRYFLNFRLWAFPQDTRSERVSVTAQLYANPDITFDLNVHVNETDTVSDVETFYQLAWERLGCVIDRHNND